MELTMVNVIVTDIDGLNYLKKLWVCFEVFDLKKNVYDEVIIFLYDDNFIPVLLLTWSAQKCFEKSKNTLQHSKYNMIDGLF
jgi:hypothetical protein